MIRTPSFSKPTLRPPIVAEAILAVLLAAQIPLWFVSLNGGEAGNAAPPIRIATPDITAVQGLDPFFRGADMSEGPLLAHTLFAVRTGADAGAILAGPDGVQKAVRPGDEVSDGVTLAQVGEDHVILAHGRARSRLDFPAAPPLSSVLRSSPPPVATTGPAHESAASAATYETALRPVQSGGVVEGYVWRPGTDGGVLAAAGLRPGDVLLRINGTPFDRHERFGELVADVSAGRAVDIEYRRNGSNYSTTYSPE